MQNNLYIVIIAGGSGTRFWPHSRKTRPKQFSTIIGDKSMYCQTLERILPLKPAGIIVVTNEQQIRTAEEQSESMGLTVTYDQEKIGPGSVLLIGEPVGRNTAPAIALATALIHKLSKPRFCMMLTNLMLLVQWGSPGHSPMVVFSGNRCGVMCHQGINPEVMKCTLLIMNSMSS